MKSMGLPSVAIFCMTYFHKAGEGWGGACPLDPPGSATEKKHSYQVHVVIHMFRLKTFDRLCLCTFILLTKYEKNVYLPPANEVWGKVIFLHLSVILFTGGEYLAGTPPPEQYMLEDTGNKRAVRIILECILVLICC